MVRTRPLFRLDPLCLGPLLPPQPGSATAWGYRPVGRVAASFLVNSLYTGAPLPTCYPQRHIPLAGRPRPLSSLYFLPQAPAVLGGAAAAASSSESPPGSPYTKMPRRADRASSSYSCAGGGDGGSWEGEEGKGGGKA